MYGFLSKLLLELEWATLGIEVCVCNILRCFASRRTTTVLRML